MTEFVTPKGLLAAQVTELAAAEVTRASVENREPDYTKVSATAGVPFSGAVNLITGEYDDAAFEHHLAKHEFGVADYSPVAEEETPEEDLSPVFIEPEFNHEDNSNPDFSIKE